RDPPLLCLSHSARPSPRFARARSSKVNLHLAKLNLRSMAFIGLIPSYKCEGCAWSAEVPQWRNRVILKRKEFLMSKFAIGDRVDKATDDHEGGVVVAVFSTDEGNFRYAVDMEGYGALQFLTEEKLVVHPC